MQETEKQKFDRLLREDGAKYQAEIIAYIEELNHRAAPKPERTN